MIELALTPAQNGLADFKGPPPSNKVYADFLPK